MTNTDTQPASPKPMFTDATYDKINKLVQIVLPAIAALYFGLAAIWGLPSAEQVVGSIALVTTFLGTLLRISNRSYNANYDGNIVVTQVPDGPKMFSLELNVDPNDLESQKVVKFQVHPSS